MNALMDADLLSGREVLDSLRPLTDQICEDTANGYTLAAEEERVTAALELLHAFALDRSDVATITDLGFDGGNDIYVLIETALRVDSGGEADYYLVASLDGIGALTSLERFDNDSYAYGTDISGLNLIG